MVNSSSSRAAVEALLVKLHPYIPDEEMLGQLSTDLNDIIESGAWLQATIEAASSSQLSGDSVESLLIEMDVRFIDHVDHHLKSMKAIFSNALQQFSDDE